MNKDDKFVSTNQYNIQQNQSNNLKETNQLKPSILYPKPTLQQPNYLKSKWL
jgi:hypothetical protein